MKRRILDYIKLIRLPNLFFIVLIQCLMARAVAMPVLKNFSLEAEIIPTFWLVILVLATVFIAAGGYVINDYFDVKIDRINHPQKVLITNTIEKSQAMFFYQVLTTVGVLLGVWVSVFSKSFTLGFIFVVVPGLLWFYSASYKRQFLVGNIMIAFCAALVPISVAILQSAFLTLKYGEFLKETIVLPTIYSWICGFAIFAFLLTFLREVIKDMQDEYGDREMECRTMVIKLGEKRTKIFLYAFVAFILFLLGWVVFFKIPFQNTVTERYFLFGILLPLIILVYLLAKAKNSSDYKVASNLTKFVMLIGTFYSVIFAFLQFSTIVN